MRRIVRSRKISLGKYGILSHLQRFGPSTAGQLAAAEQITPQAVAIALRELENLGYVERVRDETDRRRSNVVLTDSGLKTLKDETTAANAWLAKAMELHLTAEERAVVAAAVPLLNKLSEKLDD